MADLARRRGAAAGALLAIALALAGCGAAGAPGASAGAAGAPGASAGAAGAPGASAGAPGAPGASAGATATDPAASQIPPALIREARPIGRGPQFHPPATGPVLGACRRPLGARRGVHVELFAANRVVLVAAGIGVRPPVVRSEGRISGARCFGSLVTIEPTGVVLIRPGARLTLGDLFRSWGQPLSRGRLASFPAGTGGVRVYLGGRALRVRDPRAVPLSSHAEIVLEVGPEVPPHAAYVFPPGS